MSANRDVILNPFLMITLVQNGAGERGGALLSPLHTDGHTLWLWTRDTKGTAVHTI